jgi:predicted RND superfamily exporter protein
MISGTFVAIGAIGLIMVIALRSLAMGLLSLLPNSLPIAASFGVWALLVGEVGFSVSTIASISLGIVIDDTIHFMTKYMRSIREGGLTPRDAVRASFEQVGVPLLINTVILTAGFGVLAFSAFKILAEMGMLTSITIVLALVFDFLFLPGLLLHAAGAGWAKSSAKGAADAN